MKKNKSINGALRKIGLVIGSILLLWFFAPVLAGGIFNIGNATGMVLAILLIMYMVFMPTLHEQIKKWWKKPKMRIVMGIVLVCATMVVALAIIETACIITSSTKAPAENATAVVLGCRVYGERPSLSLVERLEAAYEYLEENPQAACVVSGGMGDSENISEAECMYRWLVDKGIEAERIYIEDKSTSTDENISFSKEIIEENGLNENIAIVTSEYHTYRAGKIAEENGMSYGTVPGKTAIWLFPTFYIRELYAILAEWIF